MREGMRHDWSRRQLIRAGILGAAGLASGTLAAAGPGRRARQTGPYGPFRMGLQSYSLRNFDLDTALQKTRRLGLVYWEAFQNHVALTSLPQETDAMLARLKRAQVRPLAWGVQGFEGDEAAIRRALEFAGRMKIETITADPTPQALDVMDRLLGKYKVNIAIHNHGPGSRYSTIADVQKALQGHHPRIGACIDTGHFIRSGEDPVAAVRAFGKRTYVVHLKDVRGKTEFTEIGRGDLDTVGLFRTLREIGNPAFIALEYEEHADNPGAYIDICLAATRDAIEKSGYPKS